MGKEGQPPFGQELKARFRRADQSSVWERYNLGVRVLYVLRRATRDGEDWLNPEYLDQLSDEEILKVHNIGPKSLEAIRAVIALWKEDRRLEAGQLEERQILVELRENLKPFAGREALRRDETFAHRRFTLPDVGHGEIAFVRVQESDINFFVGFSKEKGAQAVFPYGVVSVEFSTSPEKELIVLTPCEVDVTLDLSLKGEPPFCLLDLPSCQQRFVGFPRDCGEELLHYIWKDAKGQECLPLLPNREEVLQELTIIFF